MNYRNKIMYFLGIGGIGMSALARWYKQQGALIYGYDGFRSPLTDVLIKEGMIIHFEEDIDQLPKTIDIVVYTPAIPSDNIEFVHLQKMGIPIFKRSELIGNITKDYFNCRCRHTWQNQYIGTCCPHTKAFRNKCICFCRWYLQELQFQSNTIPIN